MSKFAQVLIDDGELRVQIARVEAALRGKFLEMVALRAAEPMAISARDNAPVRTGKLRDAIKARVKATTSPEIAFVSVGWKAPGHTASRHDQFYGLFVERGTRTRTRVSGGSTGRVRGRKFLKRAHDQHSSTAVTIASNLLKQRLEALGV